MLEIKNMYKTFNKNTVNENSLFNEFSLKINKGEFITVIGSNGAGKSTLLNLISGDLEIDKGEIILDSEVVHLQKDYVRAKKIGRVYQDPSLGVAQNMTILQNVALAENKGKSYGLGMGINKNKIKYYKEIIRNLDLGIEDMLNKKVSLLSGGQRQALTLLMAVIAKPKLLLLDEHTAALDPKTSKQIMNITENIVNNEKITTIMVTHNMDNAIRYGDRLVMMHGGRVVVDVKGEEKEKLTKEKLLKLFDKVKVLNHLSDCTLLS